MEQTWDPKLVTRNKPGNQNLLPRGCQEKFIKCVWKVFGWCPDSVHMLYWWCLDHVWTLSGLCLDGVWMLSWLCLDCVWNIKNVWRVSGPPWNVSECVWNLSGQCRLEHVYTMRGPNPEPVWTMSGWCPCQDHGLCGLVSSQCWDVSVTCLELVWSLSVRPSNNSSLSGI